MNIYEYTNSLIFSKEISILNYYINESIYYTNNIILEENSTNREVISEFISTLKEIKTEIKIAKKYIKVDKDNKAAKLHFEKIIKLLDSLDESLRNKEFKTMTSFLSVCILLLLHIPQKIATTFIDEKIADINFNKFVKDVTSFNGKYNNINISNIEKISKYKLGNTPVGKKHYEFDVNIQPKPGTIKNDNDKKAASEENNRASNLYNDKKAAYKNRKKLIATIGLIKDGVDLYKFYEKQSALAYIDKVQGLNRNNNNLLVNKLRLYIMDIKKYILNQMKDL